MSAVGRKRPFQYRQIASLKRSAFGQLLPLILNIQGEMLLPLFDLIVCAELIFIAS